MDHWFDDLCKRLDTNGEMSRRNILLGILASVAVTSVRAFGSAVTQISPLVIGNPQAHPGMLGVCTITKSRGQSTVRYVGQSTFNGGSLVVNMSNTTDALNDALLKVRGRRLQSDILATLAGADVLRITTEATAGLGSQSAAANLKLIYGAASGSAHDAALTIQNGVANGTVDGREIVPVPVAAGTKSFRFIDGRPAPVIKVDPNLSNAISTLVNDAAPRIKSCQKAGSPGADGHGTFNPNERRMSDHHFVDRHKGVLFAAQGSGSDDPCLDCTNNCDELALACEGLSGIACFLGPECLLGAAGCIAGQVACHASCDNPGQACCNTQCPDGACCNTGTTTGSVVCCGDIPCCYTAYSVCTNNVCCPSGQPVGCPGSSVPCWPQGFQCCGNTACPAGQHCSDSQQSLCCPVGQDVCGSGCCPTGQCRPGNVCCPPDEPICNGVCCSGGKCDGNGNCCGPPSHICGNLCCPPFNVCCGTTCCGGANDVCLSDARTGQPIQCCPASQACGVGGENPVCCPAGQMCIDQHASTCAPCPSGLVACVWPGSAPVCCPPGVVCYQNTCCRPGEIVCDPVNVPGPRGCYPPTDCVR